MCSSDLGEFEERLEDKPSPEAEEQTENSSGEEAPPAESTIEAESERTDAK